MVNKNRKKLTIQGQVQGIGFRPYIYRLASEHHLTGKIHNNSVGVCIEIQGRQTDIDKFLLSLTATPPEIPLMKISNLESADINFLAKETDFTITQSTSQQRPTAQVTADVATCTDCLNELFDENNFRFHYPFINCTNCGPRYSIIKTIPYDRANTTMSDFEMCPVCQSQYEDIADRRFHAQPIACKVLGPKIYLTNTTGKTIESDSDEIIKKTVKMLLDGNTIAIKGLGGFHLIADAQNNDAVEKLRQRKKRDYKPFAMMAANIETIKKIAIVDDVSKKLLQSPQAPVVLLPKKPNCAIAKSVCDGLSTFGVMLPYTPLHHLLLNEKIDGKKLNAIIATSGNISEEPLICNNETAIEKLSDIASAFIMHNRDIYRQVDDSVAHIIDNCPALIRRARGFVPTPVISPKPSKNDILATGADLKNTFCVVKQNQFILSEHIGDLENPAVYKHWRTSIKHLQQLYNIKPKIIACDLHPGYLSTQYAQSIKNENTRIIQIQHHHAHIASVLAEHNFTDKKVIGLVADGTGFGTDGNIWGCECLIASLSDFTRFAHLDYFSLPGGDAAAKNAIRPLMGLAHKYNVELSDSLVKKIEPDQSKIDAIKIQLQKNINTVQTSSLGRLFDAAATLIGLGAKNNFEAQLPMLLESIADGNMKEIYRFKIKQDTIKTIDIAGLIEDMIAEVKNNIAPAIISAKFHNTIAALLCDTALLASKQTNIKTVAISGGVFCNRYLSNRLIVMLKSAGFEVLYHKSIPTNDAGIALGQAAIVAEMNF